MVECKRHSIEFCFSFEEESTKYREIHIAVCACVLCTHVVFFDHVSQLDYLTSALVSYRVFDINAIFS